MRCKAWVRVEQKTRKQNKKGVGQVDVPYERVLVFGDAYARRQRKIPLPLRMSDADIRESNAAGTEDVVYYPTPPDTAPDAVLCGGRIVADVRAEDEPYYGGTSARFVCELKCERCGHTYHGPDMPDDGEAVSKIVTEYIANLPD